jgi:cytoskeletal protein RodZ
MMTLGEMLLDARKKAGVSALDVSHATRIMLASVQALEDDALDSLPAFGYVRGYILSYCRYVGEDPQPFLEQYQRQSGHSRRNSIGQDHIDVRADRHRQREHEISWKVVLIVALVIVLVGAVVWTAVGLLKRDKNTPPLPAEPAASGSVVASTTADSADFDAQEESEPFDFTVKVKKGKATKLVITVDGTEAFNGVMTGGQKESFTEVAEAELEVQKPDNLTVTQNGTRIPIPQSGELHLRAQAADN